MSVRTMRLVGVGLVVAALALAYLASTSSGTSLDTRPVIAVRNVSADATNDNGQTKLARTTDGTLYLAYSASVDDLEQAHISFSLDDGETWKPEITLGQPGVWSDLPAIAAGPDGRLDATWVDYSDVGQVWYASLQDGAWSDQAKISPGSTYAGYPAIVVAGGTANVVWYDARPSANTEHGSEYEIHHTFLTDGVWSEPELLSAGSDDALNPSMTATAGGALEAAWFQVQDNVYGAYVATYSDEGWSQPDLVSKPGQPATGVDIAADPAGLSHLVWEQSYDTGVGIAYATGDGGEWGAVEQLSDHDSHDPVVGFDDQDRVYVVWSQDGRINARIRDGGWSDAMDFGPGTNPMVLSGEKVLAAWTRQSEAGNELVAAPLEVLSGDPRPALLFGGLALILFLAGAVLVWRSFQDAAPVIDNTDLTSGK